MRKIILLCLVGLSFQSVAQTYDHYRYNNAGVPEKTGYTTVRQQPQFAPYTPSVNVTLYREVLEKKQAQYNKNIQEIKDLISMCYNTIDEVRKINSEGADEAQKALQEYLSSLNPRADYSNNYVANPIKDTIQQGINKLNQYLSENQ